MAKIVLKCLNVHRFGQKVVLPIVGEVEVSNEGTLELEEDAAKYIARTNKNWEVLSDEKESDEDDSDEEGKVAKKEKKSTKKEKKSTKVVEESEEDDETTKEDDETSEGAEVSEEDEETDEMADLEKLELPDLIELAEKLGHDKSSFDKFKKSKKLMISFLKKN